MTAIQAQQIDKCLDVLSVAKAGGEYLPVTISQEISDLLHQPTAGIGKWSHVARALVDQGKALALYATLFPERVQHKAKGGAVSRPSSKW